MPNGLKQNLDHSRAAYRYAITQLPSMDSPWPIERDGFRFCSASEVESMLVEFGWAFFCRYEGCLEAFLKRKGVQLSKKLSLKKWLEKKGVCIPKDLLSGLECYRQIRNKLHHEDGATLDGKDDEEIHLLPQHMENFYTLFVWVEKQVEES